jgi:hypothetical protein
VRDIEAGSYELSKYYNGVGGIGGQEGKEEMEVLGEGPNGRWGLE